MGHLVVFSHLRWDFVYQRPQHLLSRLARWYHILFIEEPMIREGPARLERSTPVVNVDVLRPCTPRGEAGFHDTQLPMLEHLVLEYLADEGIDDYAVWFYTPLPFPLLAALRPRAVIYDCMDELSAFKDAPSQTREREISLLAVARLVLTGGPSLYEAKRMCHPNVLCLPSAVDARHFSPEHARSDAAGMQRAHELQGTIGRPRLGFFGVIDERLDTQLVAELADADPHWHIVMVGPVVKIRPDELPQRPNLHWLGKQPYDLLPQLVAGWDVCLLPFALNESTRFISPTKTLEYMAAEKPAVSTAVHDVASLYGDVVPIAENAKAFICACKAALVETDEQRSERLRNMSVRVARYSWDATAETIHREIEDVLSIAPREGGAASLIPRTPPFDDAERHTACHSPIPRQRSPSTLRTATALPGKRPVTRHP